MTLIESDIHTAEDYGGETSNLGSTFDAANPNRPDRQ
jgi:hypothetical protein